ncbi:FGGY-family carbohydrate kinase, partial [Gluconobacter japonicus]
PYEAPASASLFGVQSWHDRADLFQAMIEGTIFNHREHVETLRLTGAVRRLGVSGGGSGQASIAQMFADILNVPVEISSVREAGALGAALTASVAVGLYDSLEDAVVAQDIPMTVYQPEPARVRIYEGIYQRYVALTQAMKPFWSGLYEGTAESLSQDETEQAPVSTFLVATEMTQEVRL